MIRDIAKQLNVTITTQEVGYKPNQLAQSLRAGKTKTIGLMVEDISNPFFASVARLIEERAYKEGYKICFLSTEEDAKKTQELIGKFRDMHVDGYIKNHFDVLGSGYFLQNL